MLTGLHGPVTQMERAVKVSTPEQHLWVSLYAREFK